MKTNNTEIDRVTQRVLIGDVTAIGELFDLLRARLWRIVSFRLRPDLHRRFRIHDVLEVAQLRAVKRMDRFPQNSTSASFIWLREMVLETIDSIHRRYPLVNRAEELSATQDWGMDVTSTSISACLSDSAIGTSGSGLDINCSARMEAAMSAMGRLERDVLTLRHFEELTNRESATVLGITVQAASAAYVRALEQLNRILAATREAVKNS